MVSGVWMVWVVVVVSGCGVCDCVWTGGVEEVDVLLLRLQLCALREQPPVAAVAQQRTAQHHSTIQHQPSISPASAQHQPPITRRHLLPASRRSAGAWLRRTSGRSPRSSSPSPLLNASTTASRAAAAPPAPHRQLPQLLSPLFAYSPPPRWYDRRRVRELGQTAGESSSATQYSTVQYSSTLGWAATCIGGGWWVGRCVSRAQVRLSSLRAPQAPLHQRPTLHSLHSTPLHSLHSTPLTPLTLRLCCFSLSSQRRPPPPPPSVSQSVSGLIAAAAVLSPTPPPSPSPLACRGGGGGGGRCAGSPLR